MFNGEEIRNGRQVNMPVYTYMKMKTKTKTIYIYIYT